MNEELPRYWTRAFVDVFVQALHDDPGFQTARNSNPHARVYRACASRRGGNSAETLG